MDVRGLLLDVEGVLVADKRYQAVPSAIEFIQAARAAHCPLRLITNNTTDARTSILEKLRAAGFAFELHELHTCTSAAIAYLRERGARRCLVLGNAALRGIFADAGLEVVEDGRVDAVIVGLDTSFSYERLALACGAIVSHGAAFVALHMNRIYTDGDGRLAPSVGALAAGVEYATQAAPVVMGKPSPDYFQRALDELGVPNEAVLVVSDDPFSDLAGAKRMGMKAAFVLSGKYERADVVERIPEEQRPDVIVPRIGELAGAGFRISDFGSQ